MRCCPLYATLLSYRILDGGCIPIHFVVFVGRMKWTRFEHMDYKGKGLLNDLSR